MTYVRWPSARGSWHVFVTWTRGGQTLVRCGRRILATVNLADDLPPGERSCESCLRATVIAADPTEPANDQVVE